MAFQDIRKSRRRLSPQETGLLLLALILLAGLLALNIYLARTLPGGEQFFLRWSGARGFLLGDVEPYSSEVAQRTQNLIYGRRAQAGEYPYALNDPFPIVLLYLPLALFSDFAIARGIWMLLSQFALVWLMVSFLRALEWEPPGWLFISLLLCGVFGYYSLIAFGAGTPAVFLAAMFFAALYALRSSADELAGALLCLTFYQWEVSALFVLFLLVFVFLNHRWRVLAGFGMTLTVLLAVSFLAYPGWGLPYLRGVLSDWYRSDALRFGAYASRWFPNVEFSIGQWTATLLGVLVFWEWIQAVNAHFRHIVWTACLSLAVTPLMGFAIFPSNHVVLLPSLFLILMLVWERWTRRRGWLPPLILLAVFLVPFWLYVQFSAGAPRLYADLLIVLPPLASLLGLYWVRWWAVRPPRIWADQLGGRR
ncbi:MAG: glycosyltransferase 87 family protein [Chloroflexota bacterium]|mgnify:CR=1 FL=1